MAQRPGSFPDWATSNPNGIVVPSSADQGTGWVPNEPPPAEYANWLQNTTSQWLRYLDEQGSSTILASSLDYSTRLIGGGQWSYTGTTLAWSAAAFIAVPSAADANNTIAAGSVSIPSGSVAYVTANMPFSTQATTTSGSAQITNVLYADMAAVGQMVTGSGIPDGTLVNAIGADGQSITLSKNATVSAANVSITFSSSGTLTVSVAASATFVPGPNTVIFARGLGTTCIVGVGSGQMLLRQGEAKALLGSGFTSSKMYTVGEPNGLLANTPVYISFGAPLVPNTTQGNVYALNTTATGSVYTATFAGYTTSNAAAGSQVEVVSAGRLGGFTFPNTFGTGVVAYAVPGDPRHPGGSPSIDSGTWNVQLGLGLSATEVFVTAGIPPVKVTVPVYKSVMPMGGIYASGAGLGGVTGTTGFIVANQGTPSQFTSVPFQWTADRAGSVVGISYDASNSVQLAQVTATLQRNGVRVAAATTSNQTASTYGITFAAGSFPFFAGDRLSAYLGISTSNPNGATVSGTASLTLAFDP